ncbi:MAG TPA: hypothetical protein VHS27_13330 [Gaiellales bacterium]|jgi:hypothetical protein|nr:hypothetical protein [Gaiellales bacterium]
MPHELPEGLKRGPSSDRPHPDRATWVRRVLLALPSLLVILGLANVFGQQASESEASSPAADLRVDAPAHLRGGLMFQVRVQVLAHRRISHPMLLFSHAWFESITLNSVNPQPAAGSSVGDRPAFEFSPVAAGHRATYWFEFQVNPTNVGWRRPENLTLADGNTTLTSVQRTLTIYP